MPWENAYRSALLLGGDTRFVLARSGHIQALVNPPARAGTESRPATATAGEFPAVPDEWLGAAATAPGTWWPDWAAWLGERSGELKAAPSKLGSRRHKAAAKAPGSYVHAS